MPFLKISDTPVGNLLLTEENGFLTSVDFVGKTSPAHKNSIEETQLLQEAERQLRAYFLGKLTSFDLPLNPKGTAFQLKCWSALQKIPYGKTISYKEEAEIVGGKHYCRAVGMANGKNPIAIIIPCHRVIGANGKLVGYSSGLDIKRKLLQIEGILINE